MASPFTAFAGLPPGERGRKVLEAIKTLGGEHDSALQEELQGTVFNKLLEQGYANDIESIVVDTRAACSVAAFLLENFYKAKASSGNFVWSAFEAVVGMLSGIYTYFEEEIVPAIKSNGPEYATKVLKSLLELHKEVIMLGTSVVDVVEISSSQTDSLKPLVNTFYDLGEITVSKAKESCKPLKMISQVEFKELVSYSNAVLHSYAQVFAKSTKIPLFTSDNEQEYNQVFKLLVIVIDLKHYGLNVLFWNALNDIIKRRGETLFPVIDMNPILTKLGPKLIEALHGSSCSPNDETFKKNYAYAQFYSKVLSTYCGIYGSVFNDQDISDFSRVYCSIVNSLPQYNPSLAKENRSDAATKTFITSDPKKFEGFLPLVINSFLRYQCQEKIGTLLNSLMSVAQGDLRKRVYATVLESIGALEQTSPKVAIGLLPALFNIDLYDTRDTICKIISIHYDGHFQRVIDAILYKVLVSGNVEQSILAHELLVSIFRAGDHNFRGYYAAQAVSFLEKTLPDSQSGSAEVQQYVPTGKGTLCILRLLSSFSYAGSEDIKQVLKMQMVKPNSSNCDISTGNWVPSPLAVAYFTHLPLDLLFSDPNLDSYFKCFTRTLDVDPNLSAALCIYGITRHRALHGKAVSVQSLMRVADIAATLVCSGEYLTVFFVSTLINILDSIVEYINASRLPSLFVMLLRYAASPSASQDLACSVASFCARCSGVQKMFSPDVASSIAIIFKELFSRGERSSTLCYVLKCFVEFALRCGDPSLINDAIPLGKEGDVEFFLQDAQLKEVPMSTSDSDSLSRTNGPPAQFKDLETTVNTLEVYLQSISPTSVLPPDVCAKLEGLCQQIHTLTSRR